MQTLTNRKFLTRVRDPRGCRILSRRTTPHNLRVGFSTSQRISWNQGGMSPGGFWLGYSDPPVDWQPPEVRCVRAGMQQCRPLPPPPPPVPWQSAAPIASPLLIIGACSESPGARYQVERLRYEAETPSEKLISVIPAQTMFPEILQRRPPLDQIFGSQQ